MANELRLFQNYLGGRLSVALPSTSTVVTDGATNSNTTVTSATAAFTANDVGAPIAGTNIPAGAYISAYTNSTTVTISATATGTGTGITFTISREKLLNSAALGSANAVTSTGHMMLTLDPDGIDGAPETVRIVLHTASATWAQIERAQDSSSVRAHRIGMDWVHGVVASDFRRGFAQTVYAPGADISTTSTSYTNIDGTNLPELELTLVVGDVVGLLIQGAWGSNAVGQIISIDWLVDQPVSADTNTRQGKYGAGVIELGTNGLDANTKGIASSFTATEAGVHGFTPQWLVSAGTGYLRGAGTYHTPIIHRVTLLGPKAN